MTLSTILLLCCGCGQQGLKEENRLLRSELDKANDRIAELEEERNRIVDLLKQNIKQLKIERAQVAPPLYVEKDQENDVSDRR